METGADGRHHIAGSCPALESNGDGGNGSSGNGTDSSTPSPVPDGSDSGSSLSSDFFQDPAAADASPPSECSSEGTADGSYAHSCLHGGQTVYTGDYEDQEPDVEAHCESLADGSTPHSCLHGGQMVYPGEYQESNAYDDTGSDQHNVSADHASLDSTDEETADHTGQFVGVSGPNGFGHVGPPETPDSDGADYEWYNENVPTDVNDDGHSTPHDALLIINELNSGGSRQLSAPSYHGGEGESGSRARRFLDTNRDRWLSPADALKVVNQLNAERSSSGEAEGEAGGELPGGRRFALSEPKSLPTSTNSPPQSRRTHPSPSRDEVHGPAPFVPPARTDSQRAVELVFSQFERGRDSDLDESLLDVLSSG